MEFHKPLGLAMGLVAINAVNTMNRNSANTHSVNTNTVDATNSGDHSHDQEVINLFIAITTLTFAMCAVLIVWWGPIYELAMLLWQILPAFPSIKALCRSFPCPPRAKNKPSAPDRLAEEGLAGSLGQGEPQPGPASEMTLPTSPPSPPPPSPPSPPPTPPPVYGSWVNDSSTNLPKYAPEVGQFQHSDPPSTAGSSVESGLSPLEQHRQSYYEEQREHMLATTHQ